MILTQRVAASGLVPCPLDYTPWKSLQSPERQARDCFAYGLQGQGAKLLRYCQMFMGFLAMTTLTFFV